LSGVLFYWVDRLNDGNMKKPVGVGFGLALVKRDKKADSPKDGHISFLSKDWAAFVGVKNCINY
jgi:hypothetical protein